MVEYEKSFAPRSKHHELSYHAQRCRLRAGVAALRATLTPTENGGKFLATSAQIHFEEAAKAVTLNADREIVEGGRPPISIACAEAVSNFLSRGYAHFGTHYAARLDVERLSEYERPPDLSLQSLNLELARIALKLEAGVGSVVGLDEMDLDRFFSAPMDDQNRLFSRDVLGGVARCLHGYMSGDLSNSSSPGEVRSQSGYWLVGDNESVRPVALVVGAWTLIELVGESLMLDDEDLLSPGSFVAPDLDGLFTFDDYVRYALYRP